MWPAANCTAPCSYRHCFWKIFLPQKQLQGITDLLSRLNSSQKQVISGFPSLTNLTILSSNIELPWGMWNIKFDSWTYSPLLFSDSLESGGSQLDLRSPPATSVGNFRIWVLATVSIMQVLISDVNIQVVVQWLRISLAMQGTWVWSLVGELRFHMLRSN